MDPMKSKPIFLSLAGAAAIAVLVLAPVFSQGQINAGTQANGGVLQEVLAQQKTIADNQAKIDEKLAAVAENIRQAKIYVTRGR